MDKALCFSLLTLVENKKSPLGKFNACAGSFPHMGRSSYSFTDEDTEAKEGGPISQEGRTQG